MPHADEFAEPQNRMVGDMSLKNLFHLLKPLDRKESKRILFHLTKLENQYSETKAHKSGLERRLDQR